MKNRIDDHMDRLTILEIAQGVGDLIDAEPQRAERNEDVIGLKHLKWMLSKVADNHEDWPLGKLGRWTGIAMGCLACHGFDVSAIRKIVADAKMAYGEGADLDLKSHLDENDPFTLDIGVGD